MNEGFVEKHTSHLILSNPALDGIRKAYEDFRTYAPDDELKHLFVSEQSSDSDTLDILPTVSSCWLFSDRIASEADNPADHTHMRQDFVIYRQKLARVEYIANSDSLTCDLTFGSGGFGGITGHLTATSPGNIEVLNDLIKMFLNNLV